jgi:phage shock protein PspC (stress-responsive transcriptional regulator)
MKKTIRIHITGYIFNIEEDAYVVLENWLDKISRQYQNEESGDEIITDIETRVAEIFQAELKDENGVISLKDVNKVIDIMGRPEDFENPEFEGTNEKTEASNEQKGSKAHKGLFRDEEQRVFGGVCSGLAHYLGLDVSLIRVIFIACIFLGGFTAVLYLIFWIFIPVAETSSQKLEMKGEPVTISNIEKVIKTEFESVKQNLIKRKDSDSFKKFTDDLHHVFNRIGEIIIKLLKVFAGFVGVLLIIIGIVMLIALFGVIFYHNVPWYIHVGDDTHLWYPFFSLFPLPFSSRLGSIGIFLFVAIPVAGIIFGGVRAIFRIKRTHTLPFRIVGTTLWLIGLFIVFFIAMNFVKNFKTQKSITKTYVLEESGINPIHLKLNNTYVKLFDDPELRISNYNVVKSGNGFMLYGIPDINVVKSKDKETKLRMVYNAKGESERDAAFHISQINWRWVREDTVLLCDPYFTVNGDNKLYMRDLSINLEVPVGKTVYIDSSLSEVVNDVEISEYMHATDIFGKKLIMSDKGLCLPSDTLALKDSIKNK